MDFSNFKHFSGTIIHQLQPATITDSSDFSLKPSGALWLAPDSDWIEWCRSAGFAPQTYHYQYGIQEIDQTKILVLKSLEDVINFCRTYRDISFPARIDWKKLAQSYAGVYLPNMGRQYFHQIMTLPNGTLFYALDVDSLVIWDTTILKLKLEETKPEGYFHDNDNDDDPSQS